MPFFRCRQRVHPLAAAVVWDRKLVLHAVRCIQEDLVEGELLDRGYAYTYMVPDNNRGISKLCTIDVLRPFRSTYMLPRKFCDEESSFFSTIWPAAASTDARRVLHGKHAAECEEIEAVGLFV